MSTTKKNEVENEHQVIPQAVAAAIEDAKSEYIRAQDATQRFAESVVRVYLACRDAGIKLKGTEVSQMIGCSQSYVSQAWRATERAIAKRKAPLEEVGRLGFKPYVRKYLVVKQSRHEAPSAPSREAPEEVGARFVEFRDLVQRNLDRLSNSQRELLLIELLDLVTLVRSGVATTPDRPRAGQTARH